jgi:hypothetical protein
VEEQRRKQQLQKKKGRTKTDKERAAAGKAAQEAAEVERRQREEEERVLREAEEKKKRQEALLALRKQVRQSCFEFGHSRCCSEFVLVVCLPGSVAPLRSLSQRHQNARLWTLLLLWKLPCSLLNCLPPSTPFTFARVCLVFDLAKGCTAPAL